MCHQQFCWDDVPYEINLRNFLRQIVCPLRKDPNYPGYIVACLLEWRFIVGGQFLHTCQRWIDIN
jgi:hypothetical protein